MKRIIGCLVFVVLVFTGCASTKSMSSDVLSPEHVKEKILAAETENVVGLSKELLDTALKALAPGQEASAKEIVQEVVFADNFNICVVKIKVEGLGEKNFTFVGILGRASNGPWGFITAFARKDSLQSGSPNSPNLSLLHFKDQCLLFT